ncbi:hypothetical protein AAHE18_13G035700 [Arachis hypogaea]|nr:uncharacterized protein DS421_13g392050 [Arachis hypogaea]QHN98729.1 uncharacterized protein DS421_13g392050 [Arachis hypogaea]
MAMKSVIIDAQQIIMFLIIGVAICFVFAESHEIIPSKEPSPPSYYTKQFPRQNPGKYGTKPTLKNCINKCIELQWPHPEDKSISRMRSMKECAENCLKSFISTIL